MGQVQPVNCHKTELQHSIELKTKADTGATGAHVHSAAITVKDGHFAMSRNRCCAGQVQHAPCRAPAARCARSRRARTARVTTAQCRQATPPGQHSYGTRPCWTAANVQTRASGPVGGTGPALGLSGHGTAARRPWRGWAAMPPRPPARPLRARCT